MQVDFLMKRYSTVCFLGIQSRVGWPEPSYPKRSRYMDVGGLGLGVCAQMEAVLVVINVYLEEKKNPVIPEFMSSDSASAFARLQVFGVTCVELGQCQTRTARINRSRVCPLASYRGTSPMRKRPPPSDPPRTLGIGLR